MKYILFFLSFIFTTTVFAQSEYITINDIRYSSVATDPYKNERCRLDVHYPKGKTNLATIVWFHGGGLTAGNKELPKALLEKGYIVIGVGYRLAPKVDVMHCIEDAAEAVSWIFQNVQKYGGDKTKIYLSGHSAGGYLVSMVTLDKHYLQKHQLDANQIAGIVPFSGQTITHFTDRKKRGIPDTQPIIDSLAPLYHVRKDAPPMLLITGDRELELLGRYEENAYFQRMLKLNGHSQHRLLELQGFDHVGMMEPAMPLLLQQIAKWEKS